MPLEPQTCRGLSPDSSGAGSDSSPRRYAGAGPDSRRPPKPWFPRLLPWEKNLSNPRHMSYDYLQDECINLQ